MAHYVKTLKNEYEIASYIAEQSKDEISEEMIQDYFFKTSAELVQVRVKDICLGDADHNASCGKKQSRYAKMPPQTRPPIVIDFDLTVADGNHRLRDAIKKCEELIWAYIPLETLESGEIEVIQWAPEDGLTMTAPKRIPNASFGM
ncbi:MAG: hypothetical protein RSG77_09920 [Hafnia sp.]